MTPDDMEAIVERVEELASLCHFHAFVAKKDLRALLLDYQERGRALTAARGFVFDATLDDRYPDHAADVLNQIDATLKGKSQ